MIFRQQNVPPKQLLKEVQNEEFSLLGSRISLKMIERKTSDHITFGIWDDVSSYLHPPKTNERPLKRGPFQKDMLVFQPLFFR